MTIEDETGWANAVIFPNLFDKQRKEILQSTFIMLQGHLQIEGEVIHIIVQKCYNLSKMLRQLTPASNEIPNVTSFAFPDRLPEPIKKDVQKEKTENVFPGSRNFK